MLGALGSILGNNVCMGMQNGSKLEFNVNGSPLN